MVDPLLAQLRGDAAPHINDGGTELGFRGDVLKPHLSHTPTPHILVQPIKVRGASRLRTGHFLYEECAVFDAEAILPETIEGIAGALHVPRFHSNAVYGCWLHFGSSRPNGSLRCIVPTAMRT